MAEASQALQQAARLFDGARRIVFFTGAGISTESGIPDFRSPGTGLWTKMKPIQFQDFVASAQVRQESWRRRFSAEPTIETAQPNRGHLAIAKLVQEGRCHSVITQNVDNLHQNSGIPEQQVIELHGNATFASCLSCGLRYELEALRAQFEQHDAVADCVDCGGVVKSATISFGQAMPEAAMQRAHAAVDDCDLMVVAGSSLLVYPAAAFPELAQQRGAALLIINREPTPLDDQADCVIHAELGSSLGYLAQLN